MYISLNGTLVAGRAPWPDFAKLAARLGYGGTDVNLGRAMQEGFAATTLLLKELRLQPAVVGLPVEFKKDEEAFSQSFASLDSAARFAQSIGCPRMGTWILPSSDTPKAELRGIYKARLTKVAEVLARSNVRLALEFVSPVHLRRLHKHEFIYRMDEMVEFAADCGANVGVMLDSWHWHHANGVPQDIVRAGLSRIVHVQVADAPDLPPERIVDSERLMPGEGVIDFGGFFGALKKIGYKDGVSPEVFGRGLKDMPPEQGARLGLDMTRAVMRKFGAL